MSKSSNQVRNLHEVSKYCDIIGLIALHVSSFVSFQFIIGTVVGRQEGLLSVYETSELSILCVGRDSILAASTIQKFSLMLSGWSCNFEVAWRRREIVLTGKIIDLAEIQPTVDSFNQQIASIDDRALNLGGVSALTRP